MGYLFGVESKHWKKDPVPKTRYLCITNFF